MTWRTANRYLKTGGRGYGAEPQRPEPQRPEPQRPGRPESKPTPARPAPTPPIHGTRPIPTPRPTPMPRPIPTRVSWPTFPARPIPEVTLEYIPKGDPPVFHPPGPGIGLRPGPAPALGRPGLLPKDHGSWKNESCFSRGSKGWKPDILTLGDAHNCPGEKGPQSEFRPPNISQGDLGYNERLFRNENDVAKALMYLGYQSPDGNAMLRGFQRHWNKVISALAYSPMRYGNLQFSIIPQGNLRTDGDIGPHTLNALEVAMMNQREAKLPWVDLVEMASITNNGYGRERRYNAAQGM